MNATDPSGMDGCHAVYGCGREQAHVRDRLLRENPPAPPTAQDKFVLGVVADFTPFVGSVKGAVDFVREPSLIGAIGILPFGKLARERASRCLRPARPRKTETGSSLSDSTRLGPFTA